MLEHSDLGGCPLPGKECGYVLATEMRWEVCQDTSMRAFLAPGWAKQRTLYPTLWILMLEGMVFEAAAATIHPRRGNPRTKDKPQGRAEPESKRTVGT